MTKGAMGCKYCGKHCTREEHPNWPALAIASKRILNFALTGGRTHQHRLVSLKPFSLIAFTGGSCVASVLSAICFGLAGEKQAACS